MTDPGAPHRQTPPPPPGTTGTSSGLAPNVAGALAYLLGPITGVLFLVLEKDNAFVRFHAAQSIGLTVAWVVFWVTYTVVTTVLGAIPVLGWIAAIGFFFLAMLLGLAGLILWLYLMYRAWSGDEWEFPWVGKQSRKFIQGGNVA